MVCLCPLWKGKPNKYCFWEVIEVSNEWIFSLICQIISLFGKIAVQNVGSVFVVGTKIIFGYNFEGFHLWINFAVILD